MRTKMEVLRIAKETPRLTFNSVLSEDKIFHCDCCGEKVSYNDLEDWICNFEEDEYTCAFCYEDGMGEDL